jgi:hypothetical protein
VAAACTVLQVSGDLNFVGQLYVVMLLGTCLLIRSDARHWGRPAARHVVSVFLLWIVFYPRYVRRRVAWGGGRWLPWLVVAACVLFLAAPWIRYSIGSYQHLSVYCDPQESEVFCEVRRYLGTRTQEVCWDIALTCGNGQGGLTHECVTAVENDNPSKIVPLSEINGYPGCDHIFELRAKNIIVSR